MQPTAWDCNQICFHSPQCSALVVMFVCNQWLSSVTISYAISYAKSHHFMLPPRAPNRGFDGWGAKGGGGFHSECFTDARRYVGKPCLASRELTRLSFYFNFLTRTTTAAACYVCRRRLLCENQARGRSGFETILGRVLSDQFLSRFGRSLEHEAASFTRGQNPIRVATKGAIEWGDVHACCTLTPHDS